MQTAQILSFLLKIAVPAFSLSSYVNNGTADIVLGGLFPVHSNIDGNCGKILDLGVQRLEAMVLAVDMINNDPTILPGLELGFDIRDTCTQPNVALQSTLDFIVGTDQSEQQQQLNSVPASNQSNVPGISGVVGSASSSESISAASLLRLFDTPQISYASTARTLSDKTRFETFFRTIPPDLFQARVMVELIIKYNWTYVIAVNSDDVYGREGINAFQSELREASTNGTSYCTVDRQFSIPVSAGDEEYERVVDQINQPWVSNSSVVVLFGQLMTAEKLFSAINRYENHRPLTFIVSDAVGNNLHTEYYPYAWGMISVIPQYRESSDFNEYFTSLRPSTNRNPWFTEYWQDMHNCSFDNLPSSSRYCNESEQSLLDVGYQQNSKVPFVLDAVYAFAHSIHNMLLSKCGSIRMCDEVVQYRYGKSVLNGALLLQFLHNVSFGGFSANVIDFDENGDQAGGYWLNNLQRPLGDGEHYQFVQIAEWNADTKLEMSSNVTQWRTVNLTQSFCSKDCKNGESPRIIEGQSSCCWVCEPCHGEREVSTGLACTSCEKGFSPSENRSFCQENPLVYLSWSDPFSALILIFTVIGLACTLTTGGIFIVFNKHTIVKASSRELTAILLTGIFLAFLIPFFSVGKPTAPTCGIERFLFGFAFSLCYAALLVKTNRIHRIFNRNANSSQRPGLISPQVQILFTSLLVSIQVVLSGAWLLVEIPGTEFNYNNRNTELTCSDTSYIGLAVSLGYNFVLLIICTYFAFRTRKIPPKL